MQTVGPALVIETIAARQPVITIENTARTLNTNESGSMVWFNRAAGNTLTLPTSPIPGTYYDVLVYTTPTSNSHKILTSIESGTAIMVGGVNFANVNTGADTCFQATDSSSYVSVNMNATTTGGQVGTRLRCTALSAGTWFVSGLVFGSGAIATPFAAVQ